MIITKAERRVLLLFKELHEERIERPGWAKYRLLVGCHYPGILVLLLKGQGKFYFRSVRPFVGLSVSIVTLTFYEKPVRTHTTSTKSNQKCSLT